jgi:hypothetical protein
MSKVRIATDAALGQDDTLDIATKLPMGHFLPHTPGRNFAIVSEMHGPMGFFENAEMAQPFLRMLCREADREKRRHDFRLYRWSERLQAWEVHQRTILLDELRKAAA